MDASAGVAAVRCGVRHGVGAGACSRGAPPPPARPTPEVTTVVAAPRDIPMTFEFLAQTQSSQSVNIQARVSGFLDKRVYTEGESCARGRSCS